MNILQTIQKTKRKVNKREQEFIRVLIEKPSEYIVTDYTQKAQTTQEEIYKWEIWIYNSKMRANLTNDMIYNEHQHNSKDGATVFDTQDSHMYTEPKIGDYNQVNDAREQKNVGMNEKYDVQIPQQENVRNEKDTLISFPHDNSWNLHTLPQKIEGETKNDTILSFCAAVCDLIDSNNDLTKYSEARKIIIQFIMNREETEISDEKDPQSDDSQSEFLENDFHKIKLSLMSGKYKRRLTRKMGKQKTNPRNKVGICSDRWWGLCFIVPDYSAHSILAKQIGVRESDWIRERYSGYTWKVIVGLSERNITQNMNAIDRFLGDSAGENWISMTLMRSYILLGQRETSQDIRNYGAIALKIASRQRRGKGLPEYQIVYKYLITALQNPETKESQIIMEITCNILYSWIFRGSCGTEIYRNSRFTEMIKLFFTKILSRLFPTRTDMNLLWNTIKAINGGCIKKPSYGSLLMPLWIMLTMKENKKYILNGFAVELIKQYLSKPEGREVVLLPEHRTVYNLFHGDGDNIHLVYSPVRNTVIPGGLKVVMGLYNFAVDSRVPSNIATEILTSIIPYEYNGTFARSIKISNRKELPLEIKNLLIEKFWTNNTIMDLNERTMTFLMLIERLGLKDLGIPGSSVHEHYTNDMSYPFFDCAKLTNLSRDLVPVTSKEEIDILGRKFQSSFYFGSCFPLTKSVLPEDREPELLTDLFEGSEHILQFLEN